MIPSLQLGGADGRGQGECKRQAARSRLHGVVPLEM